jgi:hypothetical protein
LPPSFHWHNAIHADTDTERFSMRDYGRLSCRFVTRAQRLRPSLSSSSMPRFFETLVASTASRGCRVLVAMERYPRDVKIPWTIMRDLAWTRSRADRVFSLPIPNVMTWFSSKDPLTGSRHTAIQESGGVNCSKWRLRCAWHGGIHEGTTDRWFRLIRWISVFVLKKKQMNKAT